MIEFVVDLVLIAAVLVLFTACGVTLRRHRRADQRERAEQRRLILAALSHTAAAPTAPANPGDVEPSTDPTLESPAAPRQFDAASVTALLELLEDRRPVARGALTSLLTSPRSVWAAGKRAGQNLSRRSEHP